MNTSKIKIAGAALAVLAGLAGCGLPQLYHPVAVPVPMPIPVVTVTASPTPEPEPEPSETEEPTSTLDVSDLVAAGRVIEPGASKKEILSLADTVCSSFDDGLSSKAIAKVFYESDIDPDDAAAFVVTAVDVRCPEHMDDV